jgi:hypothetical protein
VFATRCLFCSCQGGECHRTAMHWSRGGIHPSRIHSSATSIYWTKEYTGHSRTSTVKIASIGLHNNNNKMQNQPVSSLHIGYKMLGNTSLQSALSTLGTVFLYIHSNKNKLIVSPGEPGHEKKLHHPGVVVGSTRSGSGKLFYHT